MPHDLGASELQATQLPAGDHACTVWLYFRFPLSLRLVEEMLLEFGIMASYETVRRWALKFRQGFARRLRRKRPAIATFGVSRGYRQRRR